MTNQNEVVEAKNEAVVSNEFEFISLEHVLGKKDEELAALAMDTIDAERLGGKLPITALSNAEYKQIKKDCISYVKSGKNGRMQPQVDDDRLMVEAVVAAVHKDTRSNFTFRSQELLQKLGVVSAAAAAEKLLLPGEITRGAMAVQDLSGFSEKADEERREEIKN